MIDPARSSAGADVVVIGNVNVDLIVRDVRELPAPGEERLVRAADVRTGGAASNTALTLASLGVGSFVVATVGDDRLGAAMIQDLAGAGIDVSGLRAIEGARTGISIAFEAENRDRCFLTFLGSLSEVDVSLIPGAATRTPFVLITGYLLLPALARRLPSFLGKVHAAGGTVLLDTGSDPGGWSAGVRGGITELLPHVDVLLPNEQEAIAMTGDSDAAVAARRLRDAGAGWVVVKRGAQGCFAAGPDNAEDFAKAPSVRVVDTVGAGDAFNAGFVAALLDGKSPLDALRFATDVGSAFVSRASRDRYPTRDDVARVAS